MKRPKILIVLLTCLLVVACKNQNTEQQPVLLTWDRDVCKHCGMAISDPRYAAQVIAPDGKGFLFDDMGCALTWLEDQPWKDQAKIWTSDLQTKQWIEASKAHWRFGTDRTPMGYGFASSMEALENALTFEEVKKQVAEGNTMIQKHQSQQPTPTGHSHPAAMHKAVTPPNGDQLHSH